MRMTGLTIGKVKKVFVQKYNFHQILDGIQKRQEKFIQFFYSTLICLRYYYQFLDMLSGLKTKMI